LDAHKEAERIRRVLAEAEPSSYLPDLAESLNNIGVALQELGRPAESLPPLREAMTIRRRLAEINPAVYLAKLAISLRNLGAQTFALEQPTDALTRYEEALEITRELAKTNLVKYARDLVTVLVGCQSCLAKLGRTTEALNFAKEAVAISRELAGTDPDSFLSLLTISLSALRQEDEQVEAAKETVSIYRRWAATETAASLPALGKSLTIIGNDAILRKDFAAVLDPAEEAVSVYRRLAAVQPGRYTRDLAEALRMLASALTYAGEPAEARAAASEALGIYRQLVHQKGQSRETRRWLKTGLRNARLLSSLLDPGAIAAMDAKLSGRSAFLAALSYARAERDELDKSAIAQGTVTAGDGKGHGSAADPIESFAVAFWAMSITAGIFITFGFVLTTGGPRSIWTWPIVVAGQALVFAVYGALAARVPLSGPSYRWASRLANVHRGWWLGWMSFASLCRWITGWSRSHSSH
jgi:tetratricopeptide (TPR) repeat protein